MFPKPKRHIYSPNRNASNDITDSTEAIYQLPSTQNKRSTGFGFGNKMSLAVKSSSPPPASYNLPSDFQRKDLKNITSLGQGRQNVTFGSFIWQTLKRTKDNPSPDKYNIPFNKMKVGGNMGERIKTDFSLKNQRQIPGPGAYKVTATEIGNGSYFLSTYKNNISPRYFSDVNPNKEMIKSRAVHSTISYDLQQKEVGRYFNSKTFSKSKRPGLENKNLLFTPGFKYRRFSQFNGLPQK